MCWPSWSTGKARSGPRDRIGYAITYRNAASALRRFSDGKPVRFADLTARKLEGLEQYLKGTVACANGGIAYLHARAFALP
jgi:hypothetical protein